MAWARTVAVVVPSPATSSVFLATSLTSSAPIFSYGSSSSISLAMLTPSLVMVGAPHFFSSTTLRPLGPRVTFTASASWFMPRSRPRRASSSNAIILAIRRCPPGHSRATREGVSRMGRLVTHLQTSPPGDGDVRRPGRIARDDRPSAAPAPCDAAATVALPPRPLALTVCECQDLFSTPPCRVQARSPRGSRVPPPAERRSPALVRHPCGSHGNEPYLPHQVGLGS